MSEVVSKGLLTLRKSNMSPERVQIDGEMFYFKKLTIDMEDELDSIVKDSQNPNLKPPERPAENAEIEAIRKFEEEFLAYRQEAAKTFRQLTAKIMKFVLTDEAGKAFFAPEDDVYGLLNNVYAEKFSRAYMKFRQGSEATPAAAEARFPS